jgi:hypothetical protein
MRYRLNSVEISNTHEKRFEVVSVRKQMTEFNGAVSEEAKIVFITKIVSNLIK